jgi:hypothetical protein
METRAAYVTRLPERERDVVAVIVEALRLSGYLCQVANQRRADLAGTDVIGDLLVSAPHWKPGTWLMLEVKGSAGRLSTRRPRHRDGTLGLSQQDLYDAGRLYVARCLEDALAAIRDFEGRGGASLTGQC